jgi:VanZ family protein
LRRTANIANNTAMLRKFPGFLAWAYLAFIAFATLAPLQFRPTLTKTEPELVVVFERVAAYVLLGLLFSIGFPRKQRFVCSVVLGSAVLFELLQAISPDRDPGMTDAIEKLVGGGIGICAARVVLPCLSQLTRPRRDE